MASAYYREVHSTWIRGGATRCHINDALADRALPRAAGICGRNAAPNRHGADEDLLRDLHDAETRWLLPPPPVARRR